jgi:hypothetical protein
LQLALYQQYYCQVAHGWAWAVTVTVTERRVVYMAQIVRQIRLPLTDNMARPHHMAVPMDIMPADKPDVSAAHMVSDKVTVRAHMVKA